MAKPRKWPVQEFNGVKYYRKPPGYYKGNGRDGKYMHRVVWAFHHGPIPAGCHIHHRDGDRSNNDIANLECVAASKHVGKHAAEMLPKGSTAAKKHMDRIRPAASAWHGSEQGREWHSKQGKESWRNRKVMRLPCNFCGKVFDIVLGCEKRGFCSPACQSAARRASGVDDEQRSCAVCGALFTVNRYSKTRSCGAVACREALRQQAMRARL